MSDASTIYIAKLMFDVSGLQESLNNAEKQIKERTKIKVLDDSFASQLIKALEDIKEKSNAVLDEISMKAKKSLNVTGITEDMNKAADKLKALGDDIKKSIVLDDSAKQITITTDVTSSLEKAIKSLTSQVKELVAEFQKISSGGAAAEIAAAAQKIKAESDATAAATQEIKDNATQVAQTTTQTAETTAAGNDVINKSMQGVANAMLILNQNIDKVDSKISTVDKNVRGLTKDIKTYNEAIASTVANVATATAQQVDDVKTRMSRKIGADKTLGTIALDKKSLEGITSAMNTIITIIKYTAEQVRDLGVAFNNVAEDSVRAIDAIIKQMIAQQTVAIETAQSMEQVTGTDDNKDKKRAEALQNAIDKTRELVNLSIEYMSLDGKEGPMADYLQKRINAVAEEIRQIDKENAALGQEAEAQKAVAEEMEKVARAKAEIAQKKIDDANGTEVSKKSTEEAKSNLDDLLAVANKIFDSIQEKNVQLTSSFVSEMNKQTKAVKDSVQAQKEAMEQIQRSINTTVMLYKQMQTLQGEVKPMSIFDNGASGIDSVIANPTSDVQNTVVKTNDKGTYVEIASHIVKGLDESGNKVTEITDGIGNVLRQSVDLKSSIMDAIKLFTQLQDKTAKLDLLGVDGKENTVRYAELTVEVANLKERWASVSDEIKQVVLASDEARLAASKYSAVMNVVEAKRAQATADEVNAIIKQIEQEDKLVKAGEKAQVEVEGKELERVIKLYERKYELKSKIANAEYDGKSHEQYDEELTSIEKTISESSEYFRTAAEGHDRVRVAAKAYSDTLNNISTKKQEKSLESLGNLYVEYWNNMVKATEYEAKGDKENANLFTQKADGIKSTIDGIKEVNKALADQVEAMPKVEKAHTKYQETVNANAKKQADNAKKQSDDADKLAKKEADRIIKQLDSEDKLAQKEAERQRKAGEKAQMQIEAEELDRVIGLYEKKYELMTQIAKEEAAGRTHTELDSQLVNAEQSIAEASEYFRTLAQDSDDVANAVANYNAEMEKIGENKRLKDQTDAASEYKTALIDALKLQEKFNNDTASGKLVKGTAEYDTRLNGLTNSIDRAMEASSKLTDEQRTLVESTREVVNAQQAVTDSASRLADAQKPDYLKKAQDAYKNLTTAIKNYNIAKKAGDDVQMAGWKSEIDSSASVIRSIGQTIDSLDIEENVRKQILSIVQQTETALTGMNAQQSTHSSSLDGIINRYFSLYAIVRLLKKVLGDAVNYVSEYYDKMNEIRVITGLTEQEANKLGETYRQIARDMKVSSTEIADAAIYFSRQGLATDEIEKRLKYVTMYAKNANVEFERSAELFTAVINSMDLAEQEMEDGRNAAQRVADVFLAVGDSAATSGEEIAEAMQKAAVSAGQFGVSFEWLSAYIATVSETTRQEATTIGTAFNTIIARLHSIKQNGYNDEDETRINDIAKALRNIDVELMDENGNWRDMIDIFNDIAKQWGELDDKTKSYIATTMAGTKQQNVFLALMDDLGKQVNNNSRAFELYGIAVDSAGVAEKKYETYTESVTAAQERLTVALEELYSMMDANIVKSFYNSMAGIVEMFTGATEKAAGFNMILPLIAAGIVAMTVKLNAATVAGATFTEVLAAHPLVLAISVFAGLALAISAVANSIETAADRFKNANDVFDKSQQKLAQLNSVGNSANEWFDDLSVGVGMTTDALNKYNTTIETLSSISPIARQAIDDLKKGLLGEKEAAEVLNEELQKTIEQQRILSASALVTKYNNMSTNGTDIDYVGRWQSYYKGNAFTNGDENVFGDTLKHMYSMTDIKGTGSYGTDMWMSEAIFNAIKEAKTKYEKTELGKDVGLMWDIIGQEIYQSFFSDYDPKELQDAYTTQVQGFVDEIVKGIYFDADDTEQAVLKDRLFELIAGSDMAVDAKEYEAVGEKIAKYITGAIADSFSYEVSSGEYMNALFEGWFGEDWGNNAEAFIGEDGEAFAADVRDAFDEMLEAGFSEVDLKKIYSDTPIVGWDYIAEDMKDTLARKFTEAMGFIDYGFDQLQEDYKDVIGELSLGTMKLISDMMDSGVEVEAINDVFSNATGPEDFIARLRELAAQNSLTVTSIEEVENAAIKLSDVLSGISDATGFMADVKNGNKSFIDMMKTAQSMADAVSSDDFDSWTNFIDFGENGEMTWNADAARSYAIALVDAYINQAELGENAETVRKQLYDLIDAEEEIEKETKTFAEKLGDASGKIKSLANARDAIMNTDDGKLSTDDLASLIEKYPTLISYVNDVDAMNQKIGELIQQEAQAMLETYREYAKTSEELAKKSPFSDMLTEDIKTLKDIMSMPGLDPTIYAQVSQYIDMIASSSMSATNELQNLNKEILGAMMTSAFGNSNVDLTNRPVIDANKLAKAGWSDAGDGIATVYSMSYGAGNKEGSDLHWNQNVILDVTPILPNGDVLSPEELDQYIEDLIGASGNVDELFANDKNGILIDVQAVSDEESWDEAYSRVGLMMDWLHQLQEAFYGVSDAEDDALGKLTEQMEKQAENSWAATNGYAEQLNQIDEAFRNGGAQEAANVFDGLNETMRSAIAEEYPNLIRALDEARDAEKQFAAGSEEAAASQKKLDREMKSAQKYLKAKYFKDTAKATKELKEGTISVTDAYKEFNDECDQVTKAYEDITDVQSKMSKGTEVTASDVSNLEKVLGMSAEDILENWGDIPAMMDEIVRDSGYATDALNELNNAAFIRITGTSDVDFSDLQNGLVTTEGMAQDVIDKLIATGQFQVDKLPINAQAWVWENGKAVKKFLPGYYQVIKPTGNNPLKGKVGTKTNSRNGNGGGGGGGGGSDEGKGMTEVELALDKMSQIKDFQDNAQSIYKNRQGYYEQTGQLQGVIKYMELEQKELEIQKKSLEDNIGVIENYMAAKKAELASLQVGSAEYEEVADDLDKLQKAHQDYTNQVIENETAINELTESIKEQRDAIRQMQIDLRELIYSAIEDRESRTKEMLEAEIDMENEVFDLIKARYEKERDLTLELADQRIEALEQEKDLIQEELDMRKQQAEEEDKLAQLNELEAKYARISADPTRKKEALGILQEINDLRNEIAWDTAEKEAEAQQKSIDEQIESIEDYKEYIEDYYEDLFKHPQKLIEEMEDIMRRTDEEIINWLKANDEEYAASTKNTQDSMVTGWQETLDTMRGVIKTFWDEVETVISQGDDYIIKFLMDNKQDYLEAGKLQAEAYVDEWKKQLDDLHKALEDVQTKAASTYSYIQPSESGSGSSKKSGGGGGGSGGSGSNSHGYQFTYAGNDVAKSGFKTEAEAREAAIKEISKLAKAERDKNVKAHPNGGTVYEYENTQINNREKYAKSGLMSYMQGGVANFTGPAWLDGTPEKPEGIMNPQQFKLWKTMIAALEQIPRISIPTMPNVGHFDTSGGQSFNIENITVNVDNLNTDDDYDELASKVGEALMDKMSRGVVVGGIRTGR